jgi:hypothetical protein
VREKNPLYLAEAPRKRDELRLGQVLVAKAEHRMLVESRFDAAELGI